MIIDAGQICASCSDTEGRDTCQHHIECADEEVDATEFFLRSMLHELIILNMFETSVNDGGDLATRTFNKNCDFSSINIQYIKLHTCW